MIARVPIARNERHSWFGAGASVRLTSLAVVVLMLGAACGSPDPVAVRADALRRGQESFDRQQYTEAVAAFQIAVEHDPRDGATRLKLARAHHLAGNWPQAAEHSVKAADLLPDDEGAQLFAMSMMLVQGRFIDVAARSSALLRRNPDHVQALLLAGNAAARLLHSYWALWKLDETMRLGRDIDLALTELRPRTDRAADAEAARLFRRALELAPAELEPRIAFVNHLWAMGQFDIAEPMLRRVADDSTAFVLPNRALGLFYLLRRRYPDAEKYLSAAAATGDRDARVSLATAWATRRPTEAIGLLDALIREDDASGELTTTAATLEVQLGRREPAIRRIDRLLARIPGHAPALRLKAEVLFAGSDIDGAMASAQAAVDAEPRSREGHVLFGRILAANGSHARALAQLEEALHLDSSAGDEILPDIAAVALALGRTGEALEYARQAVRRDPADRTATVVLVAALIRSRDLTSAERTLAPLLAREPAAADLLLLQGQMLAQGGMTAAARGVLTRALQAAPESVDAIAELVNLDLRDGQIAAARQRADRALAQRPADPRLLMLAARAAAAAADWAAAEPKLRALLEREPQHAEAAVMLSDHLVSTGRRDEATRRLSALLALRPAGTDAATARAAHLLATLYLDQNDRLDQVLELARMARQALPDDPAVSDTLGWVYVRRNLPESAIAHLEDAVRAAPDNARYRYHLGIAYLRLGRSHDAQTALTRALQLNPAMLEASEARAALSSINR